MLRDRARVAVTGFYAGYGARDGWREFSACRGTCLRAAFERELARSETNSSQQSQAGQMSRTRDAAAGCVEAGYADLPPSAPDFMYLVPCLLEEMRAAGLWSKEGLSVEPHRVAVSFSSSKGRLSLLETKSRSGEFANEAIDDSLGWTCDNQAVNLARLTGAAGAVLSPVAACATGTHAIAMGAQWIEDGYADVVLAGAVETGLTPLIMAGYGSLGALSPTLLMRPFDRLRDGFVPAEGIGFLVLEDEAKARRRGAQIYGLVSGWSIQADATSATAMSPCGDSIARAIEVALRRAGAPAIHYINAHGTATRINDVTETRGIKSVFGSSVPVSSTKPLTGHLLGAAGAVEAVLCLLAMRENYAPPTLNLKEPDADCDLDYLPQRGRSMKIDAVMSLSYGFGGHIGALVFEKDQQSVKNQKAND